MSLSEYRKRVKHYKPTGGMPTPPMRGSSSNGSSSSSSSHRTPSPSLGRDNAAQPRLASLPMFNAFRSPDLRSADHGKLISLLILRPWLVPSGVVGMAVYLLIPCHPVYLCCHLEVGFSTILFTFRNRRNYLSLFKTCVLGIQWVWSH